MASPRVSANPGMRCPHCTRGAAARSSRQLSRLLKEVYYQCKNPACSFAWVAQVEAVRGLSPSGMPNPAVNLPVSPWRPGDIPITSDENQISLFDGPGA